MYLSRIELNPARRESRRFLSSSQVIHAAVMASFTNSEHDYAGEGRILWRLDTRRGASTPLLYVVSPHAPDFTHICEQVGWPTKREWLTKSYAPLLDNLEPGQPWAFRTTVNPVRQVIEDRSQKGGRPEHKARVPLLTVHHQQEWLIHLLSKNGMSVLNSPDFPDMPIIKHMGAERQSFTRNTDAKGQKVTIVKASFEGVVRIDQPELARRTLVGGIGRERAYGCGLVTLAQINSDSA
ncbi:type I-E CRISPR-associated protein Cas6/Cse3/CasE [Micrococcales bacterium 31B]|nr:type I-E CRISPR-associated protein Cas6/Cse3/CasE [Micrococcales bacterium 31B]